MTNPFSTFDLSTLDGGQLAADTLAQQTLLVVNVASRCGLTPQYEGLARLHADADNERFAVIGVPCNQFGGQEPGTAEEILTFCATNYGVDFPLLTKRDVNGAGRSPLYQWLVGDGPDINWNFEKFLVHRGRVARRFAPTVTPDDAELVGAVADLLED